MQQVSKFQCYSIISIGKGNNFVTYKERQTTTNLITLMIIQPKKKKITLMIKHGK